MFSTYATNLQKIFQKSLRYVSVNQTSFFNSRWKEKKYKTGQSYYPSRYEPAVYGSIYIYITVKMTHLVSSISAITGSNYGSLPNRHQIIARRNVGLSVEQLECVKLLSCMSSTMWPQQNRFRRHLQMRFAWINCSSNFTEAWSWFLSVKQLSKPVMIDFTDACTRHQASTC